MMKLTLLSAAIASAAAFAPAPQASTGSALSVSVGSKYENEIGVQVPVSAVSHCFVVAFVAIYSTFTCACLFHDVMMLSYKLPPLSTSLARILGSSVLSGTKRGRV